MEEKRYNVPGHHTVLASQGQAALIFAKRLLRQHLGFRGCPQILRLRAYYPKTKTLEYDAVCEMGSIKFFMQVIK